MSSGTSGRFAEVAGARWRAVGGAGAGCDGRFEEKFWVMRGRLWLFLVLRYLYCRFGVVGKACFAGGDSERNRRWG